MKIDIFVVVFPPLENGFARPSLEVQAYAGKLKAAGLHVWIASETDTHSRLTAMTVREIYDIGRTVSVVLTNVDGLRLEGWYGELPSIETVVDRIRSFQ